MSKAQALEKIKALLKSGSLKDIKEAHKIRLKTNTRLPRDLKFKYCKYCKILLNSANSITRKTPKSINITCKKCKNVAKIGI